MTRDEISRRRFLVGSAAGISALSAVPAALSGEASEADMPTRPLGETGMDVSLLTFGGGSQFMRNPDEKWQPLLERAVELGVNYFDTASQYGGRAELTSEERYGRILPNTATTSISAPSSTRGIPARPAARWSAAWNG